MKIIVNVTEQDSSHTVVFGSVTEENIVSIMSTFLKEVGIHLADELAPVRSSLLLRNGHTHMFDHAKLIDYKFRIESDG